MQNICNSMRNYPFLITRDLPSLPRCAVGMLGTGRTGIGVELAEVCPTLWGPFPASLGSFPAFLGPFQASSGSFPVLWGHSRYFLGSFPAGMRHGEASRSVQMWMQMQDATPCPASDPTLASPSSTRWSSQPWAFAAPPGSCHFTPKNAENSPKGVKCSESCYEPTSSCSCAEPGCPEAVTELKNCLKRGKKQKAKLCLATPHSPAT